MSGRRKNHPARQVFQVDSTEVEGGALAGDGALGGLIVDLNSSNARAAARREDFHLGLFFDLARHQRSRHYGAKSFHHEGAVDGQTKRKFCWSGGNFQTQSAHFRAK